MLPPTARVPKTPSPDVSLEAQVKCAKRELALRINVYPGWVNGGRMNKFKAEEEIEAMRGIVKTLEGLIRDRPQG